MKGGKITKERLDYIRKNYGRARLVPYAVACDMKEAGYYSNTTYIGDIERTVKKVVKMIDEEKK